MLYGLLVTGYVFVCILLILIIMIQKGKSSMGLGGLGGGSQMLFGGTGGQDIFQKITWILGAIFVCGSLVLSLMRSKQIQTFKYIRPQQTQAMPSIDNQPVEQSKEENK